jgi:hypothetical protein
MSLLARLGAGLALGGLLLTSCAHVSGRPRDFLNFFVPAPANDPWKGKVRDWQSRHELDPSGRGELRATSPIARKYVDFSRDLRRSIVRQTVEWVQEQSRIHYRADVGEDHWATLGDVIGSGQDDCDGLDLLSFVLLRRLGFEEGELYRSILVQKKTGQHHMVTLWFDQGRDTPADPFVLDPTGIVLQGLARLSEAEGWDPIELFDETAHFRVENPGVSGSVAGR